MASPRDSIEDFAALVAALDAPFVDRDAVLAGHALDEATLAVLTEAWRGRIKAEPGSLEPRFARAYQAFRHGARVEPVAPVARVKTATEQMRAMPQAIAAPLPFGGQPSPPSSEPPTLVAVGDTFPLAHTGTDAPLPFASTGPAVELTLEEYAAFRARLGVTPERRDELYRRYRIPDEPAQRQLDEAWRRRFASDRDAQKRFLALAAEQRDALLRKKP